MLLPPVVENLELEVLQAEGLGFAERAEGVWVRLEDLRMISRP